MAIETNCSGCGTRLAVGEEHAGQRARCPACGQIYTVPFSHAASERDAESPTESNPDAAGTQAAALAETSAGGSESLQQFWMLATSGKQFGPVDRDTLYRWYHEGRVGEGYQIRQGNSGPWQPADVFTPPHQTAGQQSATDPNAPFQTTAEASFSQSSPPAGTAAADSSNPYQPSPERASRSYSRPDQSALVLAMGILSFIICPIFGVVAWVMGGNGLRAIEAGEADPSNKGMLQAGYYLGIISVLLHVACIGGALLIFAVGAVTNGM